MRRLIAVATFLVFALAMPAAADIEIHCLDVGQGDATLIISSSGQTMLVDAGNNGRGNSVVNPHLASLGITELTYMVASHYHADHIGGLDEVYVGTGVSVACYDRGWDYTTQTYASYAATVAPLRQTIQDGQVIDMGNGVIVRCIALNGNGVLGEPFRQPPHNENDLSVALIVSYGSFDFFVGGDLSGSNTGSYRDIETSVAAEILAMEVDVDVYQVNHHGSRISSNAVFLAALSPAASIISVGNNGYGHPHQEAIDRLVAAGSFIYQTHQGAGGTIPPGSGRVVNGHVVIASDGITGYTVDGDFYQLGDPASIVEITAGHPAFALSVYPNPFSSVATMSYWADPGQGSSEITMHDVLGREVHAWSVIGRGQVDWDGRDAAGSALVPGVYFFRIAGPAGFTTRRVVMVR